MTDKHTGMYPAVDAEMMVKRVFAVAELLAKSVSNRKTLKKPTQKPARNSPLEILRYRGMEQRACEELEDDTKQA